MKRLSPGSCGADWFRPRCGSSVPRNIVDQTIRWRGREWRARVNLTRQPKGIRAAAMRRNSTLRVGRGEPRNRVVTCRSEFTRPARRSSREQTFAHWRRGMGSQSSFRQPGLAQAGEHVGMVFGPMPRYAPTNKCVERGRRDCDSFFERRLCCLQATQLAERCSEPAVG